ncbi:MAG: small multi-drug export protein [Candidatus Omnitrophica bacterium]|nr:small multi-drug export protein [Candidatus Omnitrophota bacterium]
MLSKIFLTFLLAMLPITELRGSIPIAIVNFHLPPGYAFVASLLGNLIPIIPILWFLEHFSDWLSRHSQIGHNVLEWVFYRTRRKTRIVERYGWLGLMLFVAIPLPGSGIWTGSIAAFLLGMKHRLAFAAMTGGVIIAGILITLGTNKLINCV